MKYVLLVLLYMFARGLPTLLHGHLGLLDQAGGISGRGSEMFDHGGHVDHILFAEHWSVAGLEHIVPELHLWPENQDSMDGRERNRRGEYKEATGWEDNHSLAVFLELTILAN